MMVLVIDPKYVRRHWPESTGAPLYSFYLNCEQLVGMYYTSVQPCGRFTTEEPDHD